MQVDFPVAHLAFQPRLDYLSVHRLARLLLHTKFLKYTKVHQVNILANPNSHLGGPIVGMVKIIQLCHQLPIHMIIMELIMEVIRLTRLEAITL